MREAWRSPGSEPAARHCQGSGIDSRRSVPEAYSFVLPDDCAVEPDLLRLVELNRRDGWAVCVSTARVDNPTRRASGTSCTRDVAIPPSTLRAVGSWSRHCSATHRPSASRLQTSDAALSLLLRMLRRPLCEFAACCIEQRDDFVVLDLMEFAVVCADRVEKLRLRPAYQVVDRSGVNSAPRSPGLPGRATKH